MAVLTTAMAEFNSGFLELLEGRRYMRHILIVPEHVPCAVCAEQPHLVEREDLPVLPHKDCQRRGGCECWYAASARDPRP